MQPTHTCVCQATSDGRLAAAAFAAVGVLSSFFGWVTYAIHFGEMIRFDWGVFLKWIGSTTNYSYYLSIYIIPKLKLTANAAENGWFQYDRFLLGQFRPIFRKNVLVSGSVLVSP